MEFKKIKKGEILSCTMYMEVLEKGLDSIKVKDSYGREFLVKGQKLIEQTMFSSEQYSSEEKVSKTKAAEVLTNARDSVFKVDYIKQDGEDRTLIGHLLNTENLMGRSDVVDLQVTGGNPMRQVDHRTTKSIILKGVKYTVKK